MKPVFARNIGDWHGPRAVGARVEEGHPQRPFVSLHRPAALGLMLTVQPRLLIIHKYIIDLLL